MTDCADSTALRIHLDHPGGELDTHLDGCSSCTRLLRSVATDAGYTKRSLALLDPPEDDDDARTLDVDTVLGVVLADMATARVDRHRAISRFRLASVGRRTALSAAAALVILIVALTPAGRSAMAEVLDAFRGERLQVVTVDPAAWATSVDPEDVRALETLGDIDMSGMAEPEEVADVAEAEAVSGIVAPSLAEAPDRFVALAPGTARLVLSAREGNGVPAELDGAALVVEAPGAIGAVYGPVDGPPEVVVGRSGPLVVRAEGAPLEAIRSFVLSREELPKDLRDQLSAIGDWRSTIPVPVPVDGPSWEEVEVAGRPAIAFGDDSGIGALIIRQDPDGVTVVVGRIAVSQALKLAAEA